MMGKQIKKSDLNVPTARGRKRGLLFIALAVALFFGAKAVHWYTNLGLLIILMDILAFCFVLYGVCELISPDESPLISIKATTEGEEKEKSKNITPLSLLVQCAEGIKSRTLELLKN